MFTYTTKIKLHNTDAAGILFFSNQFNLVHDAYEALFESLGYGFVRLIQKEQFFIPIVHAQADFYTPVHVGDEITIQVDIASIGDTSFTIGYTLHNQVNMRVGSAQTVHVTVDKSSWEKILIPDELRATLMEAQQNGLSDL